MLESSMNELGMKRLVSKAMKDAANIFLNHDKLCQFSADNKPNFLYALTNKNDVKLDLNKESPLSSALHRHHDDAAKVLLKNGVPFTHIDFKRTDGDAAQQLVYKIDAICSSDDISQAECDASFVNFNHMSGQNCNLQYHDFCLSE
jgi:hypothetical protein